MSNFVKEQEQQGLPHPGKSVEESGCNAMFAACKEKFSIRLRIKRKPNSQQRSKEHSQRILSNENVQFCLSGAKRFTKIGNKRNRADNHPEKLKLLVLELQQAYPSFYEGKGFEEAWKSVGDFIAAKKKKTKEVGVKRKRQNEELEKLRSGEIKRVKKVEKTIQEQLNRDPP